MKLVTTLRREIATILGAIVVLALLGASGASATSSARASGTTLTIAPQGPITTLNPWASGIGLNGSMLYDGAVYDQLLHLTPNGKIVPWLATAWKFTGPEDLTMTLRQGVKFTDGTPFNAAAVKANFDYAQAITTPGQCNVDLKGVKTTVKGPYSVSIHMAVPNPDILLNMATCASWMVSPQALQNPASLTTTSAGSGPYTYDQSQTVQNQKWVFVRNPNYWNKSAFPFDTVVFNFFSNATAADDAGRSGQVDFIQVVPIGDTSSGMNILKTAPDIFRGLVLADVNGKLAAPLGNKLVRQAMNYAIDRNAILKGVYNGVGRVNGGSTPFIPGLPGYSASLNNLYPYNVAKAKALMKQAGYANGFSLPVMDSPTDTNAALLQAIAGYERAIGINMTVTQNSSTFIPSMLSGQNPAFFGQYTLSLAQYQNLVGLAGGKAFWNPLHNHIPTFDKLLTKLLYASGPKADALYAQFAKAYSDEAWWVAPLVVPLTEAYSRSLLVHITTGNPNPMLYQIVPHST